jgi:diguanylate cyclase (GGDEF)-like protein/PAS domain S-box-containing protein
MSKFSNRHLSEVYPMRSFLKYPFVKTVILSFSALLCLSAPTVASSWQTGLAKRPEKNLVQPAVPGSAVFPWQACALALAGLLLLLGPVACIIYLRHRRTSRALREKEKLFRAMVKFTHDWELWLDPNGALLYSSPSCERITGFRDEDFRRDPDLLSRIIHADDRKNLTWEATDETGGFAEFRIVTRSGQLRWVEYLCCKITLSAGQNLGKRITIRDITHRKLMEKKFFERACCDCLTGLPNRIALKNNMDALLPQAMASSQIIAVMMLDLDDFKQINDTTGHAKGDELLVMLTARLRQQLHPGDMLARLGGDESILLLNNIGSATLAANRAKQKSLLAERLLKALFQSSQLTIISKSIFFGAMPGFAS